MALEISNLTRKFTLVLNGTTLVLDDPAQELTPEEVRAFLAPNYPEISASLVEGPEIQAGCQMFTIRAKSAGVKG